MSFSVTNLFDTSSVRSGSKFMAVCVLNIDLLILLLQKHSLSNIVCNFKCYNNINTFVLLHALHTYITR